VWVVVFLSDRTPSSARPVLSRLKNPTSDTLVVVDVLVVCVVVCGCSFRRCPKQCEAFIVAGAFGSKLGIGRVVIVLGVQWDHHHLGEVERPLAGLCCPCQA
jgi:hypothetical protein